MKNKEKKFGGRTLTIVLAVCFAVALGAALFALLRPTEKTVEFTPPPFDTAAERGTPTVPEELGFISPFREGMSYRFSVCGKVKVSGDTADIYLTNPAENEVYIKLRILDENGNTLGETGLVKPGEYVRGITFSTVPATGATIRLKIMGYEPQTYESAGAVNISTTAE